MPPFRNEYHDIALLNDRRYIFKVGHLKSCIQSPALNYIKDLTSKPRISTDFLSPRFLT